MANNDADRLMELLEQARKIRFELDELITRITGVSIDGKLRVGKILEKIRNEVASLFKLSVIEITSEQRPKRLTWPRHVAMYMMVKLTDSTFVQIAEAMNKKCHGTVIHAVEDVQNRCDTSAETLTSIRLIQAHLKKKFGEYTEHA